MRSTLCAKIGADLANLGSVTELDRLREGITDKMRSGPADATVGFVPSNPGASADQVFVAIAESVDALPRTRIGAVVAHHGQIERIAGLANDMRAETVGRLEPFRQRDLLCDHIDLQEQASAFGELAKVMIDACAKGGVAKALAAEARGKAQRNHPASGRSGP